MSRRLVLVASLAAMLVVAASSSASVAGHFKQFPIPTANSEPRRIAAGPDGALWFTEFRASQIGRITTGGAITPSSLSPAAPSPSTSPPARTAACGSPSRRA